MIIQPFIIRVYDFATTLFNRYKARVLADSATVKDDAFTTEYYKMCQANDMQKSIRFAWLGSAGSKYRTSGIYIYFTKIYSLLGSNDATQGTSTNQPYLSGNIAPNEKWKLKNPIGYAGYLSHTAQTFSATDAWSVSRMICLNTFATIQTIAAGGTYSRIRFTILGKIEIINESNIIVTGASTYFKYAGKNTVFHIQSAGAGSVSVYANSVLVETITIASNLTFAQDTTTTNPFYGSQFKYICRGQFLTTAQITAEYNLLRSYIPEIENVTIGTQTWATSNCEMVATPQGTVIPEMQANGNVEKYASNFSVDVNGFNTIRSTVDGNIDSILGVDNTLRAYASIDNNSHYCYKQTAFTIGKYHKVIFEYYIPATNTNVNGIVVGSEIGGFIPFVKSFDVTGSWQTGEVYGVAIGTALQFRMTKNGAQLFNGAGLVTDDLIYIKNVSVQEVGWSDSQNLYDAIYAQTSGTVEQKTYAAVKAAAMWRSPNNDVALAAIYGKRYNKFAALLLKMDIAYYNAANPTALWGWHVSTRAENTTLAALGGIALKATTNTYWTTANGTNSTGFTALGAGYAAANGTNTEYKDSALMMCSDANFARKTVDGSDTVAEVAITTEGGFIRLIKD